MLLMTHACKMFSSDYYGFQSQEKKIWLQQFKNKTNFTVETDDESLYEKTIDL